MQEKHKVIAEFLEFPVSWVAPNLYYTSKVVNQSLQIGSRGDSEIETTQGVIDFDAVGGCLLHEIGHLVTMDFNWFLDCLQNDKNFLIDCVPTDRKFTQNNYTAELYINIWEARAYEYIFDVKLSLDNIAQAVMDGEQAEDYGNTDKSMVYWKNLVNECIDLPEFCLETFLHLWSYRQDQIEKVLTNLNNVFLFAKNKI